MGIRRLFFWDFPRASIPYDIVVILILAFIFLTPREFFRDYPRAGHIVLLPAEAGSVVYWIEEELITPYPEPERIGRAQQLLERKTGKKILLSRLETVMDSDQEVRGYMAFVKPQGQ